MVQEKIITVSFTKVFDKPVTKRATSSLFVLKKAITKETRKKEVKISNKVNEAIWEKGLFKSPRRITVKVVVDKDAYAYMPDEEIPKAKDDKKAGAKAKTEEKVDSKVAPKKEETKEKTKTIKKETTKKVE